MTFFNYNFLCVQSFTLEFGVAVLTGIFTILTLLIVVVNVSELSSIISGNPIFLVTIILLLFTWCMAISGANSRSRKSIALSIVIWAIFVIVWLVLSLYFRILMKNTDFCVASHTRCASSMWLIGGGGGGGNATDDEPPVEDPGDKEILLINDLPEITFKSFHPVRTNVIPQATPVVVTTTVANTAISNQTSMVIDVNDGCGCERHPRTTTESPPSDLRTRVIEYRKNMAMYRQATEAVIQLRKKKKKVPHKELDDEPDSEEKGAESDAKGSKAAASPIEFVTMAIFLLLFLYALYVLLSYHSELKFMEDCKCTILT
ncbi:uncharacterized protein LOC111030864 [Myzus persicae]|uniref:uncharacterized protein LOC111030864 n=1 Tax=Myzus persicae TaxID=13164 RepID=UPI000B93043B|nr:uncharacterized protein LOC111030864 [Myzus persicae]